MEWYWPSSVDELDLPGYHPVTFGDPVLVGQAAELIAAAQRPGPLRRRRRAQGAGRRGAARAGRAHRHPGRDDADGPGRLPRLAPAGLGMPGMHGHYTAVTAMQRSDLLVSLGARFDDRVTGKISAFAPDAKIIHVDIDPAELGKVRRARRAASPGTAAR